MTGCIHLVHPLYHQHILYFIYQAAVTPVRISPKFKILLYLLPYPYRFLKFHPEQRNNSKLFKSQNGWGGDKRGLQTVQMFEEGCW